LTDDEQSRLFEAARSKDEWFFAYVAATLDFFCGLRGCEIKGLQWKHISFEERRLSVRISKTAAGWRDPSLNDVCLDVLRQLHSRAGSWASPSRNTTCSPGTGSTRSSIPPGL
jgi:integrase